MYCLSVYLIWTQRYHTFSDMATDHWCLSLTEVCGKVGHFSSHLCVLIGVLAKFHE